MKKKLNNKKMNNFNKVENIKMKMAMFTKGN